MKLVDNHSPVNERLKNAFLDLVNEMGFFKINVTALCQKAGIHRSTFYSYYDKKEDILNELLCDSLAQVDRISNQISTEGNSECKVPLCYFIRRSTKYHPIFRDPALTDYVVGKLVSYFKDDFRQTAGQGLEGSEDLFWFQMYGCYQLTVKYLNISDDKWEIKKNNLDQFLSRTYNDPTL